MVFKMMSSRFVSGGLVSAAIALATLGFSPAAKADSGFEQEPNGTPALAQTIDSFFSNALRPDIAISSNPRFRHATIHGSGTALPNGTNFDWFSFTIERAGGRGIFDIDHTSSIRNVPDRQNPIAHPPRNVGFDTRLFVLDSQLISQAFSDDEDATLGGLGSVANSPLGEGRSLDPYIGPGAWDFTFATAGTYYVGVNFAAIDGYRRQTGLYTLNVAIEQVPEPMAMVGLVGVMGVMVLRRRNDRQVS